MPGKKSDGNGHMAAPSECWITGAQKISSYIGVDERAIADLAAHEDLPAFKWRGRWRAMPKDLNNWTRDIARSINKARKIKKRQNAASNL